MTPEEQKLMDESFTHVDLESKDLVAERIEQLRCVPMKRQASIGIPPKTSTSRATT